MLDETRRMAVDLEEKTSCQLKKLLQYNGHQLAFEQLSHLWSVPRFFPVFPALIVIGLAVLPLEPFVSGGAGMLPPSSGGAELDVPLPLMGWTTGTGIATGRARLLETVAVKGIDAGVPWPRGSGGDDRERVARESAAAVVCRAAGLKEKDQEQFEKKCR
jgi:hypothetical protein